MNSVQLVGKLARAPVVRFEGESQICTFTLAVPEPSREGKPYVLYVPCTSYGRSAEAASLLSAEDLVSVQGRLGWHKRKAKCGQEHSTLMVNVREVQVLHDTTALTGRP
jgi:single-stranded DNA-binding protein